jgi:ABC-type branched-subunit amino acid transport system permease subunit
MGERADAADVRDPNRPLLVLRGAANGALNVAASAVVMTRTADELRGRVAAALGAIVSAVMFRPRRGLVGISALVTGGALAIAASSAPDVLPGANGLDRVVSIERLR